jgi:uncharacterized RDD family membrane protein YckC
MSYICPKCSSPFTEKTKFCKICGCNLDIELIEKPTCPKCNAIFSSEIKFCIEDGTKLVHPDKLIPKCTICKKTFLNGAKFCPNDGGEIKLDDDILRLINSNIKTPQEINNSFQETKSVSSQNNDYQLTKSYSKAPLGKRFLAYLVDSLIIALLFLPSLYFLYDIFIASFSSYYDQDYSNYSERNRLLFGLILLILPIRYALIKDGIGKGQSYGKSAVDLMVINVNTNEPCSKTNSAGRNVLFSVISAIPYIGFLIEIIMVVANTDGRKLSDLASGTQVININDYKNN